MQNQIYSIYHLSIVPSDFAAFEELIQKIVAATSEEYETTIYEYVVNADRTVVHIVERYLTHGLLPHVEQTFTLYAERFSSSRRSTSSTCMARPARRYAPSSTVSAPNTSPRSRASRADRLTGLRVSGMDEARRDLVVHTIGLEPPRPDGAHCSIAETGGFDMKSIAPTTSATEALADSAPARNAIEGYRLSGVSLRASIYQGAPAFAVRSGVGLPGRKQGETRRSQLHGMAAGRIRRRHNRARCRERPRADSARDLSAPNKD
jgi:hypothetical protein